MIEFQILLGLLAGIIGLAGFIPYILSIVRKKTIPHRVSWSVWSALGILTAASYYASGARETAILPIANAFAHVTVACLSIKYGTGGWTRTDKISLAGVLLGFGIWFFTNEPLIALMITIIIEAIGAIPTLIKTNKNPGSEDKIAWSLFLLANLINLVAIVNWTFAIAVYPVYSFAISLAMNFIIWKIPLKTQQTTKHS